MTISSNAALSAGTVITGKWRRGRYRVERMLGEGANGAVYLVSGGRDRYAMKLSGNMLDLQGEINLLKKLSGAGRSLTGFLVDADDAEAEGRTYAYYVMQYVRGEPPRAFLARQGRDWIGVIGLHLLERLHDLHRHGWVFGDLKSDNVLVAANGHVDLIDYGGVSEKGNSVRQFTELFDRGYWGAGSRVADEGYDLFAFSILVMQLIGRKRSCFSSRLLPQNRTLSALLEELEEDAAYDDYAPFLRKALKGEFTGTAEALAFWRTTSLQPGAGRGERKGAFAHAGWLPYGFAASLLLFGVALYWYIG